MLCKFLSLARCGAGGPPPSLHSTLQHVSPLYTSGPLGLVWAVATLRLLCRIPCAGGIYGLSGATLSALQLTQAGSRARQYQAHRPPFLGRPFNISGSFDTTREPRGRHPAGRRPHSPAPNLVYSTATEWRLDAFASALFVPG